MPAGTSIGGVGKNAFSRLLSSTISGISPQGSLATSRLVSVLNVTITFTAQRAHSSLVALCSQLFVQIGKPDGLYGIELPLMVGTYA